MEMSIDISSDFTEEQWKRIDAMSARVDEGNRLWKELHKDDPCEKCGTREGVDFEPTGSLARLTPLCKPCLDRMKIETAAFWRGFNEARRLDSKRSLWQRIWNQF